jgi:hypothetical protein
MKLPAPLVQAFVDFAGIVQLLQAFRQHKTIRVAADVKMPRRRATASNARPLITTLAV